MRPYPALKVMTEHLRGESIMRKSRLLITLLALFPVLGCQTMEPIHTVPSVDLNRFMGDWYVIANIPTSIEKDAYNAMESYRLAEDGTIDTTFTFNKGGFDGPQKKYRPRGFIQDRDSNAVWGMQFFWPFKAEYRIIFLNEDYTTTVIGRTKRDYVWIMARQPSIPDEDFAMILNFLEDQGYDISKVKKVPHSVNQKSS